jgi:tRNA pseudouridine38-40 synthase
MTGGRMCTVVGAGRTDAGVHAAAQVAHVDLPAAIPVAALLEGLNHRLPPQIRARAARLVGSGFHARRSAVAKLYTYRVRWREPALPWLGLREAAVAPVTDEAALLEALGLLVGRHDFASFTVPTASAASTQRTLFRVSPLRRGSGLDLEFLGDSFLRYQVRRMVGALLEVGHGRLPPDRMRRMLEQPQAGAAVATAPARGLTLERVFYRSDAVARAIAPTSVAGLRASLPLW